MISPSIRTLFVFSSSTFFTKIPYIICILLLLSHNSVIFTKCNAAILAPSSSDDTKTRTTTTTSAIDNVNKNVASVIFEKYSQELTNQSALARKFADIDLM